MNRKTVSTLLLVAILLVIGISGGLYTYYFQAIVGIYIVQIIYILTVMVNGIENGSDKLAERYNLGNNLVNSTLIYSLISLVVIVMFGIIAASVMGNIIPATA